MVTAIAATDGSQSLQHASQRLQQRRSAGIDARWNRKAHLRMGQEEVGHRPAIAPAGSVRVSGDQITNTQLRTFPH